MKTLDMKQVVISVDVFMVIVYVVCRFFYAVLPDQSVAIANTLFHGIPSGVQPFTWGNTILGLLATIILSTLATALFVSIYNKVGEK